MVVGNRPTPDGRGSHPISIGQTRANWLERPVFVGQVEMLVALIRPGAALRADLPNRPFGQKRSFNHAPDFD